MAARPATAASPAKAVGLEPLPVDDDGSSLVDVGEDSMLDVTIDDSLITVWVGDDVVSVPKIVVREKVVVYTSVPCVTTETKAEVATAEPFPVIDVRVVAGRVVEDVGDATGPDCEEFALPDAGFLQ